MLLVSTFRFLPFHENTYLVWDHTRHCLIIDPGCYTSPEQQQLDQYIRHYGLRPQAIINTHCHIDHVLGNRYCMDQYDISLWIHQEEHPLLRAMPRYAATLGYEVQPIEDNAIHYLEEGTTIPVGGSLLKVMHTPGHTPGSISLINESDQLLLSGDVLFHGRTGRIDLPGGNKDVLQRTIRERFFTLPDDYRIYPGHGPVTNIGYEKKHNLLVPA